MPRETVLASSQRPLELEVRGDLVCERSVWQDREYWIVKDSFALTYHRLRAEQYAVLRLLDGRRSLAELRDAFLVRFPGERLALRELQALVVDLHAKGLVVSNRLGRGEALLERERERRRRGWGRALGNLLYVKLPGWDPEPTLRAGHPYVRWLFHPLALAAGGLLVLAAWCTLFVHFADFQRRLPAFQEFFAWSNLLPLWLLMGGAKMLHELGHGFACKHHGGECHEIGVAFLVFSPALYCDVSDAWTLPARRRRLAIGAAGMYVELVISAFAFFAWSFSRPGLFNHLCLNVFLVTTLTTILFNLNPLLRYDGYYLLCDWLEIPNLRTRADHATRDWFATNVLGLERARDPTLPERGRSWFVLYAIASAGYRWFLVVTIVLLLYRMMKPYGLQNLGLALGFLSLATMLFTLGRTLLRILTAPRRTPVNRRRLVTSFALLLVAGGFVLGVPVPRRVEVPVLLEPQGVQHVYAHVEGVLGRRFVKPGERVAAGAPLLDLHARQPRDIALRLRTARKSAEVEVAVHRAIGDTSGEEVALAGHRALDERVREFERRLAGLRISAPIAGVVVSAAEIGERRPMAGTRSDRLRRWTGTPLDDRNAGALVAPRTHLLSIAPADEFEAVAYIGQRERNEFTLGQAVAIKLEHLPAETLTGTITEIAPRHVEALPDQLARRHGGDLATRTTSGGDEALDVAAYRAVVRLDPATPGTILRSGVRGRARITVAHRTLGQWFWRFACETFRFGL